jgi:predicted phage terminase large subunit-like protein
LRSTTRLPVVGVRPVGDKVSRAHVASPLAESGKISIPESAPWLNDFLDEMCGFSELAS